MPDLNFYSNNVILTVTSSEYILKDDNYCELGISYMDSDDELIVSILLYMNKNIC